MSAHTASMLTVLGAESIVVGVLAALFAAVWWRAREPGMGWLVAGFGLACAWYLNSEQLPPPGPDIVLPVERAWSIVIDAAVLCISTGVVRYLGLPSGPLRWMVWACGVPGVLLIGALAVGVAVPHTVFHAGVLVAYLGAAALALRNGMRDPGDGHLLLGAALLVLALLPLVMARAGVDPEQLKYLAGVSLAVFGMVLLTVWLLRRHRELSTEVERRAAAEAGLREMNARLEARVAERTSHLRELVEGLKTFNRGVSHDLRGPLGGMSNLARLAARDLQQGNPELAQRALPAIADQCDASVRMVQSMLDLARIGEVPARRERVDLRALVQAASEEALLATPVPERPQLLLGSALPVVMCDPELLRRALVNLIANAAKFTRGVSSPQVRIDAQVTGSSLTLCISDNGVGFGPEVAALAFEPFYRGHGNTYDGHGLGLSIVRRAVESMGGKAWAEGQPGQGASMCLSLPDALSTPTPESAPAPQHLASASP